MKLTFQILFQPRRALEGIKTNPQWLILFILLAGVSIIVILLQHERVVQLALDHLPSSATAEDKVAVRQSLDENLVIRCGFLPIRLIVGWAMFALTLFYACKAWSTSEVVRFGQLFSLEVAAESIMVLGRIASLIYGGDAETPFLRVPLGIDMISLPSQDAVVQMALNSVNVFSIWYFVILTMGISLIYGISKTKSVISVGAVWIVEILSNASILYVLRETLHLKL
jgi:hypothetical protein